jgi:accessory gene regulator protein AgrB
VRTDHPVTLAPQKQQKHPEAGEAAVAVNGKKIAVYVLVVFALYVIITDPAKAADYVQIAFEGISNAAKAIGDFFTWLADGAK